MSRILAIIWLVGGSAAALYFMGEPGRAVLFVGLLIFTTLYLTITSICTVLK